MSRRVLGLVRAGALLMISSALFAHHNSAALYDGDHPITLTGSVTEFRLINPHSRIKFDVKDDSGSVVNWEIEWGPPSNLYRRGWKTDSLKPGDEITVTGAPAKDGSKKVDLLKLVAPGGRIVEQGAP
jgi:hypothetical protein